MVLKFSGIYGIMIVCCALVFHLGFFVYHCPSLIRYISEMGDINYHIRKKGYGQYFISKYRWYKNIELELSIISEYRRYDISIFEVSPIWNFEIIWYSDLIVFTEPMVERKSVSLKNKNHKGFLYYTVFPREYENLLSREKGVYSIISRVKILISFFRGFVFFRGFLYKLRKA